MAGVSTGVKKKLTISSCTLDGGKISVGDESFEVMINPSGYNVTHSISYNGDQTPGEIGQEKKFSSMACLTSRGKLLNSLERKH